MKSFKTIVPAMFALGFSVNAYAAPSAEDAQKLQDSILAQTGMPASILKVTPDGDGYNASFDFTSTLAGIAKDGMEAKISPLVLHFAPQGDGKYTFSHVGDVSFTMKGPNMMVDESITDSNLKGEWGPQGFTFTQNAKKMTIKEDIQNGAEFNAKIDGGLEDLAITSSGTFEADGRTNVKLNETVGPGSFVFETSENGQPISFQAKFGGAKIDGTAKGLRASSLFSLYQLALKIGANGKPETLPSDQIKASLMAALPIFDNIDMTESVSDISVKTMLGDFAAKEVGLTFGGNGMVKDGQVHEGLKISGLSIPPSLAQPWMKSLLPQNAGFDISISGFDLAAFSKAYLEKADFNKTPPVAEEDVTAMMSTLLPGSKINFALSKTGLSNETYTLAAEGQSSFDPNGEAPPTGKAHITMKGFDAVMKAMQDAPPEAQLQASAPVGVMVKGLAKAEADGTLTWDIEGTADGKVLVNGTDVSALAGSQQ